jgi:PadR family transcriptional regulator PadR
MIGAKDVLNSAVAATDRPADDLAQKYADNLTTQLRKGMLSYLVLLIAKKSVGVGEIIARLNAAKIVATGGTVYPLLNRLARDGLLAIEWQTEDHAPPRKFYKTTELGVLVAEKFRETLADFARASETMSDNPII